MKKPNRSQKAAEVMIGNGWFDAIRLSSEMSMTSYVASQTLQSIRRSPKFETEEERRGKMVFVKVTRIFGMQSKLSRETVLWRAAIFNEPLPSQFGGDAA